MNLNNSNDKNTIFLTEMDKIIWEQWNPNNLERNNSPNFYDEYLLEIMDLFDKDIKLKDLAKYLHNVETHTLKIEGGFDKCMIVAKRMMQLQGKYLNINPWFSIWLSPKKTIRYILAHENVSQISFIFFFLGVLDVLNRAADKNFGNQFSLLTILIIAFCVAPFNVFFKLRIGGGLLTLATKKLGGEADYQKLTYAIAWASIPVLCSLLLVSIEIAIFGKEIFMSNPNLGSRNLEIIYLIINCLKLVLVFWSLALFIPCLAEINEFSNWKAIGSILLLFISIIAIIFFFMFIIYVLFK